MDQRFQTTVNTFADRLWWFKASKCLVGYQASWQFVLVHLDWLTGLLPAKAKRYLISRASQERWCQCCSRLDFQTTCNICTIFSRSQKSKVGTTEDRNMVANNSFRNKFLNLVGSLLHASSLVCPLVVVLSYFQSNLIFISQNVTPAVYVYIYIYPTEHFHKFESHYYFQSDL